ncbi:hypothetical protein [Bacillus sp. T33-2]|uniref:hypothetical protein n=1 Tax=Bacillus sp. T33-2 TaxID=2054168 RepID=UPI000C77EBEC|nr:hypothetical protein [Bacillus sp. T33-2]PLR97506.1 hypothetical protein CVD19_08450 [Bacillus sp. T33-2]
MDDTARDADIAALKERIAALERENRSLKAILSAFDKSEHVPAYRGIWKKIFEGALEGMILWDSEGNIVDINQAGIKNWN